jgi:hypothetical protein
VTWVTDESLMVVAMMVRVGAQLFCAPLYVSTLPRVPNETRIALMR